MEDKNWLAQQLDLLLTGYGYNLYNDLNRARADDLLVRQRASSLLGEAVTHLTRLATEYTTQVLPPSTRDHPYPSPEEMKPLRQIQGLRDTTSTLAARIRGLSVPTQDRTWAKFRTEATTLHYLLSSDYQLITGAEAVLNAVRDLAIADWSTAQGEAIHAGVQALEQLTRERDQFMKAAL